LSFEFRTRNAVLTPDADRWHGAAVHKSVGSTPRDSEVDAERTDNDDAAREIRERMAGEVGREIRRKDA
jgi:hypothetical protein